MAKKFEIRNSTAEFLTFVATGKEDGIQVLYKDETVWATQKAMATLFDCTTDNIGLHLKNIFKSGELIEDSVTEKISATAADRSVITKHLKNIFDSGELITDRVCAKFAHTAEDDNFITAKQMAVMTSIPQRAIERELSALQKLGVIRRIGAPRTGKWVIAEQMIKE